MREVVADHVGDVNVFVGSSFPSLKKVRHNCKSLLYILFINLISYYCLLVTYLGSISSNIFSRSTSHPVYSFDGILLSHLSKLWLLKRQHIVDRVKILA